jgi:hypothetical protein
MKRLSVLAIALLAGIPATARADILWDLVHDAGAPNPTTGSYGATSVALTNGLNCGVANNLTCGTITALSNSGLFITGNDYTQLVSSGGADGGGGDHNNGTAGPLGAYSMGTLSEKGLGLCVAGSATSPNGCDATSPPFKEIDGDAGVNFLYLNLTGVLNSGGLNRIWISSTQDLEDWLIEGTTGAIGGSYSEICHGTGNVASPGGASGFTDVATCAVNPATGYTFLRFTSVTGTGISGDFSVQALRFNSIVPEPGTMGLLATGLVALTGAGFIRRRRNNKV